LWKLKNALSPSAAAGGGITIDVETLYRFPPPQAAGLCLMIFTLNCMFRNYYFFFIDLSILISYIY